jgi:transposase
MAEMKNKNHPRYWPDEQIALLKKVWDDPAPMKTQMDLFPGRTEGALKAMGAALGLPDRRLLNSERADKSSGERIKAAIKKRPGTYDELAARLSVSQSTVRRFITKFRAEVHIKRYRRRRGDDGYRPAVWAWGAGPDAPWPKAATPRDCSNRWYRKKSRDPEWVARIRLRQKLYYAKRTGKLVRRDPAAIALFGEAGGACAE